MLKPQYENPKEYNLVFCFQRVGEAWKCSNCEVPYKARGCYGDNSSRVFKVQVVNERDPSSKVYGGRRIDWRNWNSYIEGFACRCAKLVKAKGWTVFGLQFYGKSISDLNYKICHFIY